MQVVFASHLRSYFIKCRDRDCLTPLFQWQLWLWATRS